VVPGRPRTEIGFDGGDRRGGFLGTWGGTYSGIGAAAGLDGNLASGPAYYCVISKTQTVAERDGFEPSVRTAIPRSHHLYKDARTAERAF
jgi:hypothetical protein